MVNFLESHLFSVPKSKINPIEIIVNGLCTRMYERIILQMRRFIESPSFGLLESFLLVQLEEGILHRHALGRI